MTLSTFKVTVHSTQTNRTSTQIVKGYITQCVEYLAIYNASVELDEDPDNLTVQSIINLSTSTNQQTTITCSHTI